MTDRREFLNTTLLAGTALLAGCPKTPTTNEREIRVGYISPRTGALSLFGDVDNYILARIGPALDALAIPIDSRRAHFRILAKDSASVPAMAAAAAKSLIEEDKVHLIVVGSTPDTTNPVTEVCERAGMPCISSLAPIGAWKMTGAHKTTFHFFWDLDDVMNVFFGMWREVPTNKVVGALWPDDPDGQVWAKAFGDRLHAEGFKVVDPGRYANGVTDFTPFIERWKAEKVEILTGVPIPPDFAAAWRRCAQLGFRPKVASVAKAILFPEAIDALGGELPDGLTSEVWWSPEHPFKSALTGATPRSLSYEYPGQWTQQLGFVYALFEVAADALRRAATTKREALVRALAATNIDTVVGPVKFDAQNIGRTPLVGGQWNKGQLYPWELSIVFNETAPQIPKAAKIRAIGA